MSDKISLTQEESLDKSADSYSIKDRLVMCDVCTHALEYWDTPDEYSEELYSVICKVDSSKIEKHRPDYFNIMAYDNNMLTILDSTTSFAATEKEFLDLSVNEKLVIGDACEKARDIWDNTPAYVTTIENILEKIKYKELEKLRPDELDLYAYAKEKEAIENGEIDEDEEDEYDR